MITTLPEIEKIRTLYAEAVATSRDENAETDTRSRALDDAVALRSQLDEALVELARQREVDEARGAMAGALFGSGRHREASPELRDFMTANSAVKQFTIEVPDRQFRANEMTTGAATGAATGGFLFHDAMYPRIIQSLVAGSGVLAAGATILTTSHLRDILIPVQTADMTAAQHGETEAATQTWAAQSQLTLETFRQDGFFIVTQELAKAAEYDLQGYLADCAGRALSAKVAESVATDDGSSKPNGLANAAAAGKTAASQTTVTADEVIDLYQSLALPYRRIGSFIVSDGLFSQMLRWKDGEGHYLLRTLDGATSQFMGRPLYVEPQFDDPAAGTVVAVFGDVGRFVVRMTPIQFERDDSAFLTSFMSVYRFATYLDCDLPDLAAVKKLVMAA